MPAGQGLRIAWHVQKRWVNIHQLPLLFMRLLTLCLYPAWRAEEILVMIVTRLRVLPVRLLILVLMEARAEVTSVMVVTWLRVLASGVLVLRLANARTKVTSVMVVTWLRILAGIMLVAWLRVLAKGVTTLRLMGAHAKVALVMVVTWLGIPTECLLILDLYVAWHAEDILVVIVTSLRVLAVRLLTMWLMGFCQSLSEGMG